MTTKPSHHMTIEQVVASCQLAGFSTIIIGESITVMSELDSKTLDIEDGKVLASRFNWAIMRLTRVGQKPIKPKPVEYL